MYKIIQFNNITNKGNRVIEYDYNIIKIVPTYEQALEYSLKLKRRTKKLYKIERV